MGWQIPKQGPNALGVFKKLEIRSLSFFTLSPWAGSDDDGDDDDDDGDDGDDDDGDDDDVDNDLASGMPHMRL